VRKLRPGNVIVLPPRQEHSLRARSEAAVLVTLLLRKGDAGDQGGAGHRRDLDKDTPVKP
jgi:hypothetical protein